MHRPYRSTYYNFHLFPKLIANFFRYSSSHFLSSFEFSRSDHTLFDFRSTSAINKIILEYAQLSPLEPIIIAIPELFCNSVILSLSCDNVTFISYECDEFLIPVSDSVLDILNNNKLSFYFHVHYFGIYRRIPSALLKVLRKHGVLIIEDCVHSFSYPSNKPPFGDLLIFSLYKHFSLPYGALVILRKSINKYISNIDSLASAFYSISFTDRLNNFSLWFKWFLKVFILHPLRIFNTPASLPLYEHSQPYKLSSASPDRLITALAYTQLNSSKNTTVHKFNYDLYVFYLSLILPGVLFEQYTYSHLIPFKLLDSLDKHHVLNRLYRYGFPVTTWPDVSSDFKHRNYSSSVSQSISNQLYLSNPFSTKIATSKSFYRKLLLPLVKRCTLKVISPSEYLQFLDKSSQASYLQSVSYSFSKSQISNCDPIYISVVLDGIYTISVACINVKRLKSLLSVGLCNLGPVDLSLSFLSSDHIKFISLLVLKREKSKLRLPFIIYKPFIKFSDFNTSLLKQSGFVKLPFSESYTTGFLDLTCSTADLRSSLASKWRNVLNKTEKLGLNVHSLDINHESINFIIKEYRRHQLERLHRYQVFTSFSVESSFIKLSLHSFKSL